jgi:hypothetical protein
MWDWLRAKRGDKIEPLRGAPAVRRQKTYSAQSGYVYLYYYEGHRPSRRAGAPGVEYVFDVSADRKTTFPVSVFLAARAVEAWESAHGRELDATERYAIVKLALFQAFDERETPEHMRAEIAPGAPDVGTLLDTLGVD